MASHNFNFEGGEYLTQIGATWFVSYCYFKNVNKSHENWKKISTAANRISVYSRTENYHKYWLQKIVCMDKERLNTNKIGLDANQTIAMAQELLKVY